MPSIIADSVIHKAIGFLNEKNFVDHQKELANEIAGRLLVLNQSIEGNELFLQKFQVRLNAEIFQLMLHTSHRQFMKLLPLLDVSHA